MLTYIAVGSNLGDKVGNCRRAVDAIASRAENLLIRCSSFYLTEPVGIKDQDWFVNGVIAVETSLEPRELLNSLLSIEAALGRRRGVRFGPRIIDLDILYYGARVIEEEDLQVPHPRLQERRFVLVPLAEIAPSLEDPRYRKKVSEILTELKGGERVMPLPPQGGGKICPA